MKENGISKIPRDSWQPLDSLVESQLNLQIAIAMGRHFDFLIRHGLKSCRRVADLGTGNGGFLKTLAAKETAIQFVGIDKRESLLKRAAKNSPKNTAWLLVDAQDSADSLQNLDGLLMRYFFLHVPNALEILQGWVPKLLSGGHVWVIDVDLADFRCSPPHPGFEALRSLVLDFCREHSVDSHAGQNIGPLLKEAGLKDVRSELDPFASSNTNLEQLAQFIKQEATLYHVLLGRPENDVSLKQIHDFAENEVRQGHAQISYGMILWHGRT
jgi:ubiquinone/menaquinone biosynthesis C-methylase UbiE